MGFTREMYKLGFEISPVILLRRDSAGHSRRNALIVALTQSASLLRDCLEEP